MAKVGYFPPNEASREANAGIATRFTPGVVAAIDGPTRLGPEAAGAITLLHVTFANDEDAQRGYREFAAIKPSFCSLPGFIRWMTFSDGVDTYTLGLWRSAEDVMEFVRGDVHQRVVQAQRRDGFEHSQFAGLWTAHTVGRRTMHCENCRLAVVAPANVCPRCHAGLDDTFPGDAASSTLNAAHSSQPSRT